MKRIEDIILKDIDEFCAQNPISLRQFGIAITGNHKMVLRLQSGKSMTSHSINKLYEFIGFEIEIKKTNISKCK